MHELLPVRHVVHRLDEVRAAHPRAYAVQRERALHSGPLFGVEAQEAREEDYGGHGPQEHPARNGPLRGQHGAEARHVPGHEQQQPRDKLAPDPSLHLPLVQADLSQVEAVLERRHKVPPLVGPQAPELVHVLGRRRDLPLAIPREARVEHVVEQQRGALHQRRLRAVARLHRLTVLRDVQDAAHVPRDQDARRAAPRAHIDAGPDAHNGERLHKRLRPQVARLHTAAQYFRHDDVADLPVIRAAGRDQGPPERPPEIEVIFPIRQLSHARWTPVQQDVGIRDEVEGREQRLLAGALEAREARV
mmetsp:Transcript_84933/g.226620  ORF Transcript_84933/g.226620 Transcript_84933/m.226620 type:complete len:304 (-) Transcript_84933:989-1900(-)